MIELALPDEPEIVKWARSHNLNVFVVCHQEKRVTANLQDPSGGSPWDGAVVCDNCVVYYGFGPTPRKAILDLAARIGGRTMQFGKVIPTFTDAEEFLHECSGQTSF